MLAAVSMGSDFTYIPTTGTIIGVMAALSVLTGIVNSLSTYWMEKMTKTYVIFHILILVTCSIALLAKCENRHNATYVFTDVNPTSGWSPIGFSWLFGFLSVSWTVSIIWTTLSVHPNLPPSPSLHSMNRVYVPFTEGTLNPITSADDRLRCYGSHHRGNL